MDRIMKVHKSALIAGVDEAGRGPLAGPVVAAAVILDPDKQIEGLDDSKKLTEMARTRLDRTIRENALAWSLARIEHGIIDRINILNASMLAMQEAVEKLDILPEHVQVDGNRCPKLEYSSEAIIGGDALVPAISAASILAKVERDRIMVEMEQKFPGYGFARNKGYPTRQHREALQRLGACEIHRRSFTPVQKSLF